MARTVSFNMRQAMQAQETSDYPILLMTINHPDLGITLRFSTDYTQRFTDVPLVYGTISRGVRYDFLPISAILPDDKDQSPPQARLILDNVDREVIRLIRSSSQPATVRMEMVLASNPNWVEIEYPELDLVSADYNASSVTLTLEINALLNEPIPAGRFDPAGFPGLF